MTPRPAAAASWLLRATAAWVSLGALLCAGCGNLALSADSFGAAGPGIPGGPSDSGSFADVPAIGIPDVQDSGPGRSAPTTQGSPLCGITTNGVACNPDPPDGGQVVACQAVGDSGMTGYPADSGVPTEDASTSDDASSVDAGMAEDSAVPPIDSGTALDAGGPGSDLFACRVVPNEAGTGVAPECVSSGQGEDGAACATGGDCAAGFECVGDPMHGVCRQYCCYNSCNGGSIADASPTMQGPNVPSPFCDIEPMSGAPGNAVPVCVTKPSCTLFQACPSSPNAATPTETCTIVDNTSGTTACVVPGPQGVGDSCEEAHCKAGLACWGLFPMRMCAQLCDASNVCPNGMMCQSNYSNFGTTDTSIGICEPSPPSP